MASSAEEQMVLIDQILRNSTLDAAQKVEKIAQLRQSASATKPAQTAVVNGTGNDMSPEQKMALITYNLQETLNKEIMEDILIKEKRPIRIYWGTATTGRPHCGYFVPVIKIAEYLRAGCNVKVLLADIHGFLDNLKAPINLVKLRAAYYKRVVVALMKTLEIPIDKLEFVLGSSYQLSEKYQMDLLRASTVVTMHDARKAGAEVVKQVENATLSGLIYPLMQALDEEYLDVDVQFGGVDQRKIFTHAKDLLPKLGYRQRAHLMNPMVPGLAGGKMSASEPNSKIDVLEKPDMVKKKISKAYCVPQEVDGNGVLGLVQYTLLPASALKLGKPSFVIDNEKGEPVSYDSIEKIQEDYKNNIITPQTLKTAVASALNELLAPIQAEYEASPDWQLLTDQAYPPEDVKKIKKVKKDKGSKYPGTGASTPQVEAQPDGSVEGNDKDKVDLATSAADAMKNLKVEKDITETS